MSQLNMWFGTQLLIHFGDSFWWTLQADCVLKTLMNVHYIQLGVVTEHHARIPTARIYAIVAMVTRAVSVT